MLLTQTLSCILILSLRAVTLGIGPEVGFAIEDETKTWNDFTSDVRLNSVKSYMYLKGSAYVRSSNNLFCS